jgi:hypothetical protein
LLCRAGIVVDERAIAERYRLLSAQGVLDERTRRLWRRQRRGRLVLAVCRRWSGRRGSRSRRSCGGLIELESGVGRGRGKSVGTVAL